MVPRGRRLLLELWGVSPHSKHYHRELSPSPGVQVLQGSPGIAKKGMHWGEISSALRKKITPHIMCS